MDIDGFHTRLQPGRETIPATPVIPVSKAKLCQQLLNNIMNDPSPLDLSQVEKHRANKLFRAQQLEQSFFNLEACSISNNIVKRTAEGNETSRWSQYPDDVLAVAKVVVIGH